MSRPKPDEWGAILARFEAPISKFDCGQYCSPYNNGEPFCCSTQHAIPVVFVEEWQHLKAQSDLWHLFKPRNNHERRMKDELASALRLIECKGFMHCERENRSLSCRAFPFFPYVTREDEFIGLAYYWYFEDRCWVISNLQIVTHTYVDQFVATYEDLFKRMPDEKEHYRDYSATMRRVFSRWGRTIPLVHRDGGFYAVSPETGQLRRTTPDRFMRHGPYKAKDES
ncbi:MAG: PKD domain-containing protein [Vicinamibacterales bacterium]